MRISDWSSDVCSSDLGDDPGLLRLPPRPAAHPALGALPADRRAHLWADRACRGHLRHHRHRSEEHTSELQSLMRISYAVFCLKKKKKNKQIQNNIMSQTNKRHSDIEHTIILNL